MKKNHWNRKNVLSPPRHFFTDLPGVVSRCSSFNYIFYEICNARVNSSIAIDARSPEPHTMFHWKWSNFPRGAENRCAGRPGKRAVCHARSAQHCMGSGGSWKSRFIIIKLNLYKIMLALKSMLKFWDNNIDILIFSWISSFLLLFLRTIS